MSKQPKRKPKKTRQDTAEIARSVVEQAIGEKLDGAPLEPDEQLLPGQVVASQGGKARAKKLTKQRRSEIARKAALARWKNPQRPA